MTKVLVVVFDGLQPAQVRHDLMPNLASFADDGVTFANHHPVYPTVTRANASSMVTGVSPGVHGIAANTFVARDFNPDQAIPALEPYLAQVAQKTGRVQLATNLAEVLSQHHQEYISIGVGTSGNAYLHNPTADVVGGATIHPDFTLPYALHEDITARFGPWPDEARPNTARMAHAVRILTEYIIPERDPSVALIWSSEPDKSQHDAGVGSDLSNAAVGEADAQFGNILKWLVETGRGAGIDIMVVSDHGYSTITETVNVRELVKEAGFPEGGEPGGVAVAHNGGSVLFYTSPEDRDTAIRLTKWLMAQPWCGNLTVSDLAEGVQGTLPGSLVGSGGEGVALGLDEGLDALRRTVEAAGQRGDLVLAFDIDPRGQITRAQRLDSGLEALQSPREAAGERPGADGDGERQDAEGGEEADRRRVEYVAALGADLDEAAVRQRQSEGLAPPLARPRRTFLGRPQGPAQAAEQLALRPEYADAGVEVLAEPGEGGVGLGPGRAGRRQQLDDERTHAPAKFRVRALLVCQPPAEDGEHAKEHDDAEQRQVDLQEEAPPHESSSWLRTKR